MKVRAAQRIKVLPAIALSMLRQVVRPLWRAVGQWIEADGLRMSAAMSFYGILSLAPLLVLLVAVLGWWLDRNYIETSLVNQIRNVVGNQGALLVQEPVQRSETLPGHRRIGDRIRAFAVRRYRCVCRVARRV